MMVQKGNVKMAVYSLMLLSIDSIQYCWWTVLCDLKTCSFTLHSSVFSHQDTNWNTKYCCYTLSSGDWPGDQPPPWRTWSHCCCSQWSTMSRFLLGLAWRPSRRFFGASIFTTDDIALAGHPQLDLFHPPRQCEAVGRTLWGRGGNRVHIIF